MITGIAWHGTGILCVVGVIFFIRRIFMSLRGKNRKTIVLSITLGFFLGFLGAISGAMCMVYLVDDISIFNSTGEILFLIRAIESISFIFLGSFLFSFVAARILQSYCIKDIVIQTSFVATAIIIAHPIVYSWGKSIRATL